MVPFCFRRPRALVWLASRWCAQPVGWKPTAAGEGEARRRRVAEDGGHQRGATSMRLPARPSAAHPARARRPYGHGPTVGEPPAVMLEQLGHMLLAHHPQWDCSRGGPPQAEGPGRQRWAAAPQARQMQQAGVQSRTVAPGPGCCRRRLQSSPLPPPALRPPARHPMTCPTCRAPLPRCRPAALAVQPNLRPLTRVQVGFVVVSRQQAAVLLGQVQAVQDLQQGRHAAGGARGQGAERAAGSGYTRRCGMLAKLPAAAGSASPPHPAASRPRHDPLAVHLALDAVPPTAHPLCAWLPTRRSCAAARAPPPGTAAPCLQAHPLGRRRMGTLHLRAPNDRRRQPAPVTPAAVHAPALALPHAPLRSNCHGACPDREGRPGSAHRWCRSQTGRGSWG